MSAEPDNRSPEWHERRRRAIGSSDIAALIGLSPWGSPYSVWADKVLGADGFDSEQMEWGRLHEPAIVDKSARRLGVEITGRHVYVQHPRYPWAASELDATWADRPAEAHGVLEVKSTRDWKWEAVPAHYEVQVQWQLETADEPEAWIGCLHAGSMLELYRVERDRKVGAALIRIAGRFWERHVAAMIPPPVDGQAATSTALARRYPTPEPALVADVSDLAADVSRLREIAGSQRALKAERAVLENRLKSALGAAETGQIDGAEVVSWHPHIRPQIDSERLRADHPQIAEDYTVRKPVRRFLIKEDTHAGREEPRQLAEGRNQRAIGNSR